MNTVTITIENRAARNRRNESIMASRIRDAFVNYSVDESFNPQNDFFSVRDASLAENIAAQYERAMSRDHEYVFEYLTHHVLNGNGYVRCSEEGDYVVGNPCISMEGKETLWALSHFAPKTLASGVRFIRALALSGQPIVVAVPRKQARMLMRCGWELVGMCRQEFGGELIYKFLLVNRGVDDDLLDAIYEVTEDTLLRNRMP